MMFELEKWKQYVSKMDERLLFVTVSGAHAYGFPSPDSDVDLRGCHQLPTESLVGLATPSETIDRMSIEDGVEVDLVSHELGKYLRLLVTNNGYILEQVFSPLVVTGAEFLAELRPIARRCVTRYHFFHYRGFFATQKKLLGQEDPKRVKTLLYAYRVLMTGIHLLETGDVEPNLLVLNERFGHSYIDELVQMKQVAEQVGGQDLDWEFHFNELGRLEAQMGEAFESSTLPEDRDRASVNKLLVRLRMDYLSAD
ncbi:MAG: putative nucleotidyltransferase [Pirellulaceae bacterium]|jgi:predicted nucleotidyltransferase